MCCFCVVVCVCVCFVFFCQAEDGIRYLVRSRGLGDVYKRQTEGGSKAYFKQAGDDEDDPIHRFCR